MINLVGRMLPKNVDFQCTAVVLVEDGVVHSPEEGMEDGDLEYSTVVAVVSVVTVLVLP